MVKLFRIKNKALRWAAGSVVFVCFLAAICCLFFVIGHVPTRVLNIPSFSFGENPTVVQFMAAGLLTCLVILFLFLMIFIFALGAKKIGDELFNSVGDSKKEGDS